MGSAQDHHRYAEQCVARARRSDDDNDKALWLTLAQSWVRLAEHVARSETSPATSPARPPGDGADGKAGEAGEDLLEIPVSDQE